MNELQLEVNQQSTEMAPSPELVTQQVPEAASPETAETNLTDTNQAIAEKPKFEPVPVQFVGPKTASTFGPPISAAENMDEVKLAKSEGQEGSGTKPKFSLKKLFGLSGD